MDITDRIGLRSPAISRIVSLSRDGLRTDMLRLDEIHPSVSGNKWFKLLPYLKEALGSKKRIVSFGGSRSNHLHALAHAAALLGIPCTGFVRGEEYRHRSTPTLDDCRNLGMELRYISRSDYRHKREAVLFAELQKIYGACTMIPEGGNGENGIGGAGAIAAFIPKHYSHICVPVGSGATLAGLSRALPAHQQLIGFAPMKNGSYLESSIAQQTDRRNWQLTDRFHFGGFGKMNDALKQFMDAFESQEHIPLDRVYTAKMMAGIARLIEENYFPEDAHILCIHTGGLQGNR